MVMVLTILLPRIFLAYTKLSSRGKVKYNLLALDGCTQSRTHAQQLLEDEIEVLKVCNKEGNEIQTIRHPEQNCAVCDTRLIDPDWDICEECNNNCHTKCMTDVDEAHIDDVETMKKVQ